MTLKFLSSAVLVTILSTPTLAQQPVSPGWSAFSGCWAPVTVEGQTASSLDAKVCVVPAGANGAELLSVVGDKITDRTSINADGQRHDVARQGCSGWETAAFSADGRRLYMDSEQLCAGGLKRKTSGLFAMTSSGEWVNVVNVSAAGGDGLRVARYAPLATSSALPAEIASTFESRALSDRTARVAARAKVSPGAIIEASKFLGPPVIEAWIAELEQPFSLDEHTLILLADADVAPSVIDVMVAVSNPRQFAVKATGGGVSTTQNQSAGRRDAMRSRDDCYSPMFDPWGYHEYDPCDPYRRYGYYGARQYGYGRDRYSRYDGYDHYGYGSYGGYGGPVVIVVRGSPSDPERVHGKMTKDGYRRGSSTSTGTASTASTGDRPATSTSTTRTSDPASTSSTSGSSGSSSGRTATRKPPTN